MVSSSKIRLFNVHWNLLFSVATFFFFPFFPIPKKGNAKGRPNYHTIAPIPHASKATLKILQARPQQHANREPPDVQAGPRKGRGTRDQTANTRWTIEKARAPEKHPLPPYRPCQSPRRCGPQQTVENSERDGNTRPPDLSPEKSTCRSGSNSYN